MSATHHTIHIEAPPARVYDALLDPQLIARWRVPSGMRCRVHEFDARVGGTFRVSLMYDIPDAVGKSGEHTDTYRGRFERLVPGECVEELVEFETSDPTMVGMMRITTRLAPEGDGTRLTAVHAGLPPGVAPADNEAGWRESLEKLAALLRPARATTAPDPPPGLRA